jgi:membrane-bound metal-dependent hydrolase YbcI (DUF457 family)
MWPWGHVAIGYLLYSGVSRTTHDGPPGSIAAIAVGVAAILPDLVDKPLAWWVAVLPNGRSLAHSALTAIVLLAALEYVARRYQRRAPATAVSIGYVSHLFADGLYPAIAGEVDALAYLLWPVLPPIEYETPQTFAAHLSNLALTPQTGFELVLTATALACWYVDGTPGVDRLGAAVGIDGLIGR